MSLIQQALEKAGRVPKEERVLPLEEKLPDFDRSALADILPVRKERPVRSQTRLFAVAFFVTFGVVVTGYTLWGNLRGLLPHKENTMVVMNQRYRLSGITVSDSKKIALINDRVLSEGDRVGSARVARIDSSEVVLDMNGRTYRLSLDY